jgi:hypothetical protein
MRPREHRRMLTVFVVHVAPGADPEKLLSDEIRRDTNAQIMTVDDAKQIGFSGLQVDAGGLEVRLVAVNSRDRSWIHRTLEASDAVARFEAHEVDV